MFVCPACLKTARVRPDRRAPGDDGDAGVEGRRRRRRDQKHEDDPSRVCHFRSYQRAPANSHRPWPTPPATSAVGGVTPPLTSRGCLTPVEGDNHTILFHLDYLKLSLFALAERVIEIVEHGLRVR